MGRDLLRVFFLFYFFFYGIDIIKHTLRYGVYLTKEKHTENTRRYDTFSCLNLFE